MFLTVPIEKVRDMPVRVQELLGYKSLGGVGVVDAGNPMERLRQALVFPIRNNKSLRRTLVIKPK